MSRSLPLVQAAMLALATAAANASSPQSRALGATKSVGGSAPTRKALSWPLDNIIGETTTPTRWSCGSRFTPPEYPGQNVTLHNGVALADTCFQGPGPFHVYVIGDWGGHGNPPTAAHEVARRGWVNGADDEVQQRIARLMAERSQQPGHEPDYILNMGDNFYWAGLEAACTEPTDWSEQWINIYENIYAGPGIDGKQWLGVLGNHDYGGFRFDMGWPQNIAYTWTPGGRWMTPAQYYSAKVHYPDFTVDYFFVDSNVFDAYPVDQNVEHNICSVKHNFKSSCTGQGGPADVWECPSYFKDMWQRQYDWLNQRLDMSSADWQIVVTHFPPTWGVESWAALSAKYGIDLVLSGHIHGQRFWDMGDDQNPIKPTAVIISGGGGGITSESNPRPDGHDDEYGFVDLTITKTQIVVEMISHQGILRNSGVVLQRGRSLGPRAPLDPTSPRPPSPDPEGPEQLQRRAKELSTAQASWTARKAEWIARKEQAAEDEQATDDEQAAEDEKSAENEKVAEHEQAAEDEKPAEYVKVTLESEDEKAAEDKEETSAWKREMLVGVVVFLIVAALCMGGFFRETIARHAEELRWAMRRKGTHDPLPQVPPCSEQLPGRSATAAAGGTIAAQRRQDCRSWLDDRSPGDSWPHGSAGSCRQDAAPLLLQLREPAGIQGSVGSLAQDAPATSLSPRREPLWIQGPVGSHARDAPAATLSPLQEPPWIQGSVGSPVLKGKAKIPQAFNGEHM